MSRLGEHGGDAQSIDRFVEDLVRDAPKHASVCCRQPPDIYVRGAPSPLYAVDVQDVAVGILEPGRLEVSKAVDVAVQLAAR